MSSIDLDAQDGRKTALRQLLLIREFENTVKNRFADGEIPGFVHLSLGQEAVGVGGCAPLDAADYITSTHRGHGHAIAKGLDPETMMAELYGKQDGYCRGKGGSMHIANLDEGMLGAQAIVGASVSWATGAAITAKQQGTNRVSLAFLGDGAVAAGQVHEAINLAATWELPVIYVIENNLYSEGMVFDKQHNIEDLADMAAAYGIPGTIVDGQNVMDVYREVRAAKQRALKNKGPTLIEAKTYRYRGHFEGDPEPYRDESEVREWQETRDPINTFKQYLIDEGELSETEFVEMQEDASSTIDAAVDHAQTSPEPDPDEAYEDIYDDPVPGVEAFREQRLTDGGDR